MRSLGFIFGIKTDKTTNAVDKLPLKSAVDACEDDHTDSNDNCVLSEIGVSPSESYSNKYEDGILSEESVETAEISIAEVSHLFKVFQRLLSLCKDTREKHRLVKKIKTICGQFAHSKSSFANEDLGCGLGEPCTALQPLLEEIQAEPAALRARHALALYNFCVELDQEIEDELLSSGTGFLAALRQESGGGLSDPAPAPIPPTLARCREVNLVKIYRNLLRVRGYLPSAGELNEILIRADALFRELPNILMVPLPVVVVGDIHGQIRDLLEQILPAGGPLVSEEILRAASTPSPLPNTAKKNSTASKGSANSGPKIHPKGPTKVGGVLPENAKAPPSSSASNQTDASALRTKPMAGKRKKSSEGARGEAELANKSPSPGTTRTPTYLFLGDFVDRGKGSLQCLCLLLVAKMLSPDTIFLIRGNHECSLINRHYGFLEECHQMYPIIQNQVCDSVLISPPILSTEGESLKSTAQAEKNSSKRTSRPGHGPRPANQTSREEMKAAAVDHAAQLARERAAMETMEWDLGDHPIWIIANRLFEALPLCAAIYETVEGSELDAKSRESTPPKEPKLEKGVKPKFFSSERSEEDKRRVVRIFATHGGLSPFIRNSLDGIIAINRFKVIENGALADLTWSDPVSKHQGFSNSRYQVVSDSANCLTTDDTNHHLVFQDDFDFSAKIEYNGSLIGFSHNARGTGHTFGEDITCSFLKMNKFNYIIRAHQCVQQGFQWIHQHRVLTIFSAPNYCGIKNKGSIAILDAHGTPQLIQYGHTEAAEDEDGEAAAPIPPRDFF
ncbi:unnamed protein product [Phytomonas sp. Hart1]|nr:unnamed protein product [Phytomonas sp. Hart1]|eukprot:CCW66960.1 unnamed protein product [Phytomonas sp. isolate Hart1]